MMASILDRDRWQPSPGLPPTGGECHLWLADLARADGALLADGTAESVLDAAERQSLLRFRVESARRVFTASRTLQRRIAAHYTGSQPRDVVIDRVCEHCGGDHGKPRVPGSRIDYSVSHSGDLLVVAVVGAGRVGVDVEHVRQRVADLDDLARTVFAPAELTSYQALASADRPSCFYRAWTRKEAVVKLTGYGLRQSLSSVDVTADLLPSGTVPAGSGAAKTSVEYGIYLRDLPGRDDYPAALASTTRIDTVRHVVPGTAATPAGPAAN
ncbi:MAG TPA: 4'-phosphopantetheinyl transferase superfamily protein [Streptosporangiaceae bacterium]|nr:4'-phosphopantetheinyl transferase superfamily protein [Streptosporangiaceae bacterium]